MTAGLPENIVTQQDLAGAILDLGRYEQWLRQAAAQQRAGAPQPAEPLISEPARELLESADGAAADMAKLESLITELRQVKDTIPHITITLAAPPPAALKLSIAAWCRKNLRPDLLVDFRFNSTILGGLVVSCGSHTYDLSFRRQILANLQKFPEILRRV